MKSLFPIGLLMVIVFFGCEEEIDDNKICSDLNIIYNQESSWIGWKCDITITYPDTLTIYERIIKPGYQANFSTYLIDKNVMDSLGQYLQELMEINLEDYYGFGPEKPTDLPITFLKYTYCGTKDSCFIYSPIENEVPIEAELLLARINRTVQDFLKKQ